MGVAAFTGSNKLRLSSFLSRQVLDSSKILKQKCRDYMMRRHGWQRPLHPLQIVGMAIYAFLVVSFYCFLGLFLGNRIAEITVTTVFSFVEDGKEDPSNLYKKEVPRSMEYHTSIEPLLPFPLVVKDDAIAPDPKEDDISFCALCDFEVKKNSKHCRSCNRCVEGFDHHCRWLNNCIGKRNYTTFFLLLTFVLLMLVIEGGTAVAIFIRCFADKKGIEGELERKLYLDFPRGLLATISVLLVLMAAYGSAALGQLYFFHIVLIRKGMRTYDYILAMREENQPMELDPFNDSDFSSDDSSEFDSPEKPTFVSRFICRGQRMNQNPTRRLSIRIDEDPATSNLIKKQGFRAGIDPWKLIKMSKEKALLAAEKARERLMKQKPVVEHDALQPLPLETKRWTSNEPREENSK
ncbi:Protein S-acyltransferase 18 [Vitis vinifera]|uniref:S-acyltransferase n=1 Tax=Vitis vinifera TaxID=29760 RepID=A0A438IY36_VITVI|nr:Protein S-acyltransferase 18 [Vitis vinifera]